MRRMGGKNNQLLSRARELRREMTKQERRLWYGFLRSYPVKIYKQRIIDSFIVDFYCHAAKLVIELDGSHHYTDDGKLRDVERSAMLEGHGLRVIRFSNDDVEQRFAAVCEEIDRQIQSALSVGFADSSPNGGALQHPR